MKDTEYHDVVLHRPVKDDERKARNWKLADKAPHFGCTVGELSNVLKAGNHFFEKGVCSVLASCRIPPGRSGHIRVRLIGYAYRSVHARMAFNARVRTCSGVWVFTLPCR